MTQSVQRLRDEIALREASLADARRELAAGELSSGEAAAIEARERAALAEAHEALKAHEVDLAHAASGELSGEVASSRARRAARTLRARHRWQLLVALGCFVVAVVVVLWSSITPRQAGTSITGSVQLARQQEVTQLLSEAQSDVANGNVVAALSAYQQVLAISPKNAQALTQAGWLDFSAGSSNTNPVLVNLCHLYTTPRPPD
jgi:Tfp pilus assembly protein PilF